MAGLAGYVGAFYIAQQHALAMDSADKVTVTDPTGGELDFAAANDFSIEMWLNVPSTTGANTVDADDLLDKNRVGIGYGIELNKTVASDYTLEFVLDDGTSDVNVIGTTIVDTGKWIHYVATRDAGTKVYTYLNGQFEVSDTDVTTTTLANGSDVIFGNSGNVNLGVKLGLVRIFNVKLSAAQVSDLYQGDFPGGLSSSLKGEWMFYEGSGTSLHDSSGQGNDGTVVNASWVTTTYDTETTEAVGTGTGTAKNFSLDYENVDNANMTITVSGIAQTYGNDYTVTPKGTLLFNTAPTSDYAIVATTYRHYPMTIEAGGFTSWGIDQVGDPLETTDFRSTGWKTFKPGLKGWTGSAERHWINPLTKNLLQRKCILKFFTDEANEKYYTGWGIVSGFHPSTAVDTLVNESLDFQGTDRLGTETT